MKLSWIAPVALLVSGTTLANEISSTLTLTNDYRFRGISQSAGDVAIQGSLDAAFNNGLFIGAWASNVDFGDDANLEIDWYAGYAGDISETLSYDATLYYYSYPGYDDVDGDYAELDLNLYYGDLKLEYAVTNDYFNTSETGHYVAVDYSYPMNDNFTLDLHGGHSFGNYWDELDIGAYSDYSIGVSSSYASFDVALAYLVNDVDTGFKTDDGAYRNDNTLLLSVSRTF